jgi:hypothetical protein
MLCGIRLILATRTFTIPSPGIQRYAVPRSVSIPFHRTQRNPGGDFRNKNLKDGRGNVALFCGRDEDTAPL